MRKLLLSSVAFAALAGTTPALSAGAPAYNWTGLYVGANVGGAIARNKTSDPAYWNLDPSTPPGFFNTGIAGDSFIHGPKGCSANT